MQIFSTSDALFASGTWSRASGSCASHEVCWSPNFSSSAATLRFSSYCQRSFSSTYSTCTNLGCSVLWSYLYSRPMPLHCWQTPGIINQDAEAKEPQPYQRYAPSAPGPTYTPWMSAWRSQLPHFFSDRYHLRQLLKPRFLRFWDVYGEIIY